MKQRVTNKQATELKKTDTVTLNSVFEIRMLANDLLDARAQLDIAVKALEDIASRRGESFMIASCALEEIKE